MAFFLLLLPCVCAFSDTLELSNGDRITGHITSMDEDYVVVKTDYGEIKIDRSHVVSGSFGPQTAIPTEGLLFHFDFEGDFADMSGNSYAMESRNGVTLVAGVDNKAQSAASADGSGQYLEVQTGEELDGLNTFSLSFWILIRDAAKFQYLVSKWSSTSGENADGKFALSCGGGHLALYVVDEQGAYHSVVVNNVVSLNEWTHVAVVLEPGAVRLFADGDLVRESSLGFQSLYRDNSSILFLTAATGSSPDWSRYNVVGAIDKIRLYNRALSEAEVRTLAEGL